MCVGGGGGGGEGGGGKYLKEWFNLPSDDTRRQLAEQCSLTMKHGGDDPKLQITLAMSSEDLEETLMPSHLLTGRRLLSLYTRLCTTYV